MIGLGSSISQASVLTPSAEELIVDAFRKRVSLDGGTLENGNSLLSDLNDLTSTVLGGFSSMPVANAPDDENVLAAFTFSDETMDVLLGYDGANNSAGDQLGGTYTLEVSRLDGSDNPIAGTGGTSSGTVYAYRADGAAGHNPGSVYISAVNNSSGIASSNFEAEGSALIDLSTFGGDDITTSATSSNYRFTLTLSASGYLPTRIVTAAISIDKP